MINFQNLVWIKIIMNLNKIEWKINMMLMNIQIKKICKKIRLSNNIITKNKMNTIDVCIIYQIKYIYNIKSNKIKNIYLFS